MSLKNKYIELSKDYDSLEQYSETAIGKYGKIFIFQNSNFRLLTSFITNYKTFKNDANGKDRSKWEHNKNHGQEKPKQHTNNMIKSRLFSKNERTFYKTQKGTVVEQIPEEFKEEEKWIIIYFLLIDSYFDNVPNYILKRTEEVFENFLVYENSKIAIIKMIKDFIIKSKDKNIEELWKNDYLYYDSFFMPYKNHDFLFNYVNSSIEEKEELYQYIINDYNEYKSILYDAKKSNIEISTSAKNALLNYKFSSCLTKKYQPTGVFNKNMLVDNAKLLYLTDYVNNNDFQDFNEYIVNILDFYNEWQSIDKEKVFKFIFANKKIFEMSYMNAFKDDYLDNVIFEEEMTSDQENILLETIQEKIVLENIEDIKRVNGILKRKALERANYKCELEEYCGCSNHYFTNKKTGKNYVEMHHLIPREFANDFEKSIEQIENYISLCPRCHRYIHFAVDRERRNALHYLYMKRIESLKIKGIQIEENLLKSYYRLED